MLSKLASNIFDLASTSRVTVTSELEMRFSCHMIWNRERYYDLSLNIMNQ